MRKIFVIIFVCISAVLAAQTEDSLRSPFSIYCGAGIGIGRGFGLEGDHYGFETIQYEDAFYADFNFRAGMLWNEKFGFTVLFGQLGNTQDGSRFSEEYADAYPGYSFLVEYSDIDFGYRYRYITPQFTYRVGREPFNTTFNVGVGIGHLRGASGNAIFKKDSSNYFIEQYFHGHDAWNMNVAASVEFAYMRQLSQHWFMNTGISLGYNGVIQNYMYTTSIFTYSVPEGNFYSGSISGLVNHASAGIFVYFQWNTKESARAYYE